MTSSDLLTESAEVATADPGAWARSRRRLPRLRGSILTGLILLFWPLVAAFLLGFVIDPAGLRIAATLPGLAPSAEHLLGSDTAGRDILALLVQGTPPTFLIGFLAGLVATAIGTIIGLVSGYSRGIVDSVLRGVVDVMLGLPALAVAIIVAAIVGAISTLQLGILIAALLWAYPARQVRSQVLSLREQQFVFISKLSNQGPLRIMFLEILPNILPFVMAAFVAAVSFSILLAIGLQLIGLGSAEPTLGLVLQLAIGGGALSRGLWWWWAPPTLILVSMFVGLFLVSTAVDRFSNPRLREVKADG